MLSLKATMDGASPAPLFSPMARFWFSVPMPPAFMRRTRPIRRQRLLCSTKRRCLAAQHYSAAGRPRPSFPVTKRFWSLAAIMRNTSQRCKSPHSIPPGSGLTKTIISPAITSFSAAPAGNPTRTFTFTRLTIRPRRGPMEALTPPTQTADLSLTLFHSPAGATGREFQRERCRRPVRDAGRC